MNEVMAAVGVDAVTRERLPGQDPPLDTLPIDEIATAVEGLGVEHLGKIVTTAALDGLELGRDDLRALVGFSREFTTYVQRVFGFPDAFGFAASAAVSALSVALAAPAVALLHAREPEGMQEVRALFEEATPRFAAMNSILDAIPADYHAWFRGPRFGRPGLSSHAREDLARRLELFAREQPIEFSLVAT